MRKSAIIMVLGFAATLSAADYSGIWNGQGGIEDPKYGSVPHATQMTLIQAGTSLSGTVKMENSAPMPIKSGTVSGSQLTFQISNGTSRVTAVLTQAGAQLTGKMTSSTGEVYDVAFTKQ